MSSIVTPRLELIPMSLELVDAVIAGDRARAERAAGAALPPQWPNRALVERAFYASIEEIRADPERRLWGDRLIIGREGAPMVVGSVVFHGRPENGVAEVGYGIEEGSQHNGLATEATRACVDWALTHDYITAVRATTFSWHAASLRVMAKLGMAQIGVEQHDTLGELLVFEVRKP